MSSYRELNMTNYNRTFSCWTCDSVQWIQQGGQPSRNVVCRLNPPDISRVADPCCSGSPPYAVAAPSKKASAEPEHAIAAPSAPQNTDSTIEHLIADGPSYWCQRYQRTQRNVPPIPAVQIQAPY